MNANTNGQKLTILYARLSKGDELLGESNSISNQRKLLEEYAERNGFTPHICITEIIITRLIQFDFYFLPNPKRVQAIEKGCIFAPPPKSNRQKV